MSQATIPFQSAPLLDDAPLPEGDETTNNRRALFALAALAGLALLGIAAYFLLFAGGDEETPAVTPPASKTAPKVAPPAPAAEAPVVQKKLSAKRFGTDPFKPLISEPVAVPAAAAGAPATGTPAGGTTTSGSTTTGGTATATGTTGASVLVTGTSYKFQVVRVAANNSSVDVKINGKTHSKLQAGEVFAKVFKVRFIGGTVNSFQIGDEVFNVAGTKVVNVSG